MQRRLTEEANMASTPHPYRHLDQGAAPKFASASEIVLLTGKSSLLSFRLQGYI